MANKQWWTVSAVYEDNGQSYVDHFEAKTWQDAWKKALHKADGIITKSAIFEGKLNAVDFDEANSVVPIRGKSHTIEVANVRITARHVVVPGRCPKCKKDLRRANSLIETYLVAHQWRAHLSHNDRDISGERDGAIGRDREKVIDAARLECSSCKALIWDGFHVD